MLNHFRQMVHKESIHGKRVGRFVKVIEVMVLHKVTGEQFVILLVI